jgi:DMSO/TMAO reductase YedYZ heme-binding membrane subunit
MTASITIFAASASQLSHRATSSWTWYIVRASGFISLGLLFLSILMGIGFVTGWTYRVFEPVKAWAIHRALGIALIFSVLTHVTFILLDHFVPFTIFQVLVPFTSSYQPLFVGFGILAAYCLSLILLTSLTRLIDTKKTLWKWTHYLSYIAIALIFFHALYSGTDFKHGIIHWSWIILGMVLLLYGIPRLFRIGATKRKAVTASKN